MIPAASKAALDLPEHLEVRPGRIEKNLSECHAVRAAFGALSAS